MAGGERGRQQRAANDATVTIKKALRARNPEGLK